MRFAIEYCQSEWLAVLFMGFRHLQGRNRRTFMKKLLILGAGGHGQVVAETAAACGYEQIAFLDDNDPNVSGTISELDKFHDCYEECFVGIGNNRLRLELLQKAEASGFKLPILIHPTAYVSGSARIQKGTIIEPMAVVNSHAMVGAGSIISVGAIVDHDALLESAVHINAGAVVKAGGMVGTFEKLEAGEVRLGYPVHTAGTYTLQPEQKQTKS